jgi:acyl-CoA thioesterase FadM
LVCFNSNKQKTIEIPQQMKDALTLLKSWKII